MPKYFLTLLVAALTFAFGAFAEENTRELHVLSAVEGKIRTGDRIHGPEVSINVNRPGKTVILALSPRTPIRFRVTVDAATTVEEVILFGKRANYSEVYVDDMPVEARVLGDVPYVDGDIGISFRNSLASLTRMADVDRISSVQALLKKPESPLMIAAITDLPRLKATYLPELVQPDRLSEKFRAVVDGQTPVTSIEFTDSGFVLTEKGVSTSFPITLDVPRISHPVAAAYDPEGKRIFGVTLGGEGFLYLYDIANQKWSILASMENEDATGMVYDRAKDRLVMAVLGSRKRGGRLRIWSEAEGLQQITLGIAAEDLPGLTDLFGSARSGPHPALIPLAIEGNELLVLSVPARYGRRHRESAPKSRTYIFNMDTSEAALVAYDGD